MKLSHDDSHAITLYLDNKTICDWHNSNVHSTFGVETRDVYSQSIPQIPSRLPREYESPSPYHRPWYTGVVNTVVRYSNVLRLHQRVCQKSRRYHGKHIQIQIILWDSNSYFQEQRRPNTINQVDWYHPISILHPKKWFLILLNWSLFITHPTDWNKCMTCKNA